MDLLRRPLVENFPDKFGLVHVVSPAVCFENLVSSLGDLCAQVAVFRHAVGNFHVSLVVVVVGSGLNGCHRPARAGRWRRAAREGLLRAGGSLLLSCPERRPVRTESPSCRQLDLVLAPLRDIHDFLPLGHGGRRATKGPGRFADATKVLNNFFGVHSGADFLGSDFRCQVFFFGIPIAKMARMSV